MSVVEQAVRYLVLVADDEEDIRTLVTLRLQRAGYEVIEAKDGEEALRLAAERKPDLLVLDVSMPGRSGTAVTRELQEQGPAAPPVILLTAHGHTSARIEGLESGAVDYIVKPFDPAELTARVRAALRMKASRDALAGTDALTGLLNRRGLDARAAEAVALAQRHGRPLACLMLDLDHFKRVNDTHGHAAGDAVLQETAARLIGVSRVSDVVGRYGGEEFTLLLPETELDGAAATGEKVREGIAQRPFAVENSEIEVRVSVGVAVWNHDMTAAHDLFAAADRALYRAKKLGRDRVEVGDSVS
jgi:two-component system cell cycle response regulator